MTKRMKYGYLLRQATLLQLIDLETITPPHKQKRKIANFLFLWGGKLVLTAHLYLFIYRLAVVFLCIGIRSYQRFREYTFIPFLTNKHIFRIGKNNFDILVHLG